MEIVTETGWVCKKCRTRSRQLFQQLQSGQAKLAEEVATMKASIASLQSTICGLTVPTGAMAMQPDSDGPERLLSTVREADRRKITVV